MDKQKEALKLKIAEAKMVLAQKRMEIVELKEKLSSGYLQIQQLSNSTDESNKKTMLLQLNAEKLRTKLAYTEEASTVVKSMLEFNSLKHRSGRSDRITQVETALQELHLKASALRQMSNGSSQTNKCALRELVNRRLAPFSVAELLEGTMNIHLKVNQELKEEVSRINLERDCCQLRQEMSHIGVNFNQNGMPKLAAIALKLRMENTIQKQKNAGKQQHLAVLKNELVQFVEECYKADSPGELPLPVEDIRRWIDLRLQAWAAPVIVEGRCRQMQELKASTVDLDIQQWKVSKQEKIICANKDELKKILNCLNQEMMRVKMYPDHLAALQHKVLRNLNGFSLDSLVLIKEMISRLKGSVAQEVKAFETIPLIALHHTSLSSGPPVATYQLLIQYWLALPHVQPGSPLPPLISLLTGAPLGPVEDVVMNLYEKKGYCARLQRELNDEQLLTSVPAYSKGKESCSTTDELLLHIKQVYATSEVLLSELQESSISLETGLSKLKETFHMWLHHPVIAAVPPEMLVEGKTLVEWVDCYKENLHFLDEEDSIIEPLSP